MGKCVSKTIPINFISLQENFWQKYVEKQKEMLPESTADRQV